jgi:hypothetical protein
MELDKVQMCALALQEEDYWTVQNKHLLTRRNHPILSFKQKVGQENPIKLQIPSLSIDIL